MKTLRDTTGKEIQCERHNWYDLNIPENRYVIDARWFYQYAEGVTGQSRDRTIYTTPEGFKTKTAARAFMKLINMKSYHKKGRRDVGYGSVGEESLTVDIVAAGLIRENRYDFIGGTYVIKEEI